MSWYNMGFSKSDGGLGLQDLEFFKYIVEKSSRQLEAEEFELMAVVAQDLV
jgi:hypothetical protein